MNLKDLQSDLEALTKLYGLLQCGGEDVSNVFLGERSKLLLKDLLDGDTESVLEMQKEKTSAAEQGVHATSCSSDSENLRAISEFQPSLSPYVVKTEPGVLQNSIEESDDYASKPKIDEHSSPKLATHEVVSQQSRLSFSLDKPENRKSFRQCSEESSMNQQQIKSRNLSKYPDAKGQQCDPLGHFCTANGDERKFLEKNGKSMKLERSNAIARQKSVGSVADFSRCPVSGENLPNQDENKGEAANNFTKDVDTILKHIESHISALSLYSKLTDTSGGAEPLDSCSMPTSVCSMMQAKQHSVNKSKKSHSVEPFPDMGESRLFGIESQGIGSKDNLNGSDHVLGLTERSMLDDIMSKRRRIQHNEIGQPSKHIERSNSRLYTTIGNRNENDMVEADSHKQSQTASCYVQGLRVPTKQGDITKRPPTPVRMPYSIQTNSSRGKKASSKIAKVRPSMIPTQSASLKAFVRHFSDKKGLSNQILPEQRKGDREILQNKILLSSKQEFEDSSTCGSSDSEAYSSTSQDSAGSMSRRFVHGSCEDSSSSTSSDYRDADESGRNYPTRTDKAINPVNPKSMKGVGRLGKLKRLKNSLAVIFHHHHHHHHHRYDHNHYGNDQRRSTWTHLNKVFHPKHRHEVQDKLKKGRVSIVPVKHQTGHFHALVDKFMHNLRHSKKSKHSKDGIGRLGNNQNGNKNRMVKKKLHWWNKFQRQHKVRLPNRKQVRMGFMSIRS